MNLYIWLCCLCLLTVDGWIFIYGYAVCACSLLMDGVSSLAVFRLYLLTVSDSVTNTCPRQLVLDCSLMEIHVEKYLDCFWYVVPSCQVLLPKTKQLLWRFNAKYYIHVVCRPWYSRVIHFVFSKGYRRW